MAKEKKYKYLTKAVTLPNGKRKYVRAKTQKELKSKLSALERELITGVNICDDTTVAELTQTWVDMFKRKILAPQSLRLLLSRLNNHVMPYIGQMKVREVKPVHIVDIVNNHGYDSRNSNSTLLSNLRSIFDFAVDNDIITKSPVPKMLRAAGTDTTDEPVLTPQQSNQLLSTLRGTSSYLFVLIALTTGMRRGEILGLQWDCVDFKNGIIDVRRQLTQHGDARDCVLTDKLKTAAAYRRIPMSKDLRIALTEEKLRNRSDFVVCDRYGNGLDKNKYRTFERNWEKLDMSEELHIHAHLFRHTYATRLVESGMDVKQVQYLLGHTDLKMTLGLYAKYDLLSREEETKAAVQEVFSKITRVS